MSGGNRKRKDIQSGIDQSKQFTNRAISAVDPFRSVGLGATGVLASSVGLGDPSRSLAAFNASPFRSQFENNFGLEADRIDSALANQGLLFSGARLEANARAKAQTFNDAFSRFQGTLGGLSNQGFSASGAQANLLADQGNRTLNAQLGKATTRQGFLGGLTSFGDALSSLPGI